MSKANRNRVRKLKFRESLDSQKTRIIETIVRRCTETLGYGDVQQNNPHHFGTVGQHTEAVMEAASGLTGLGERKLLLWAAGYHDLGKYVTRHVNEKTGFDQFIGHADKSVEILKEHEDEFLPGMSKGEKEYVEELIRLHDTKYNKEAKCRAMVEAHPSGFAADLIKLQYADICGQSADIVRVHDMPENWQKGVLRSTKLDAELAFIDLLAKVVPEYEQGDLGDIRDIVEDARDDARKHEEELLKPQYITKEIRHGEPMTPLRFDSFEDIETLHGIGGHYHTCDMAGNYEYGCAPAHGISIEAYCGEITYIGMDGRDIFVPEDYNIYPGKDVEQMIIREINERDGRTAYIEKIREEMPTKYFLARTETGKDIYADENTIRHQLAHSDVETRLIREAVGRSTYEGPFQMKSIDMGRTVGLDHCVPISDNDNIIRAVRKGRETESVIALGRKPEPTSLITLGLCRDDDGKDAMFSAFCGQLAPKEMSDPRLRSEEVEESIEFWHSHALALGIDGIDWDKTLEKNPEALQFAPDPTAEQMMAAVQKKGECLAFIPEDKQTEAMAKAAVKQNGRAIQYVKERYQTPEICALAYRQDPNSKQHFKDKPPEFIHEVHRLCAELEARLRTELSFSQQAELAKKQTDSTEGRTQADD